MSTQESLEMPPQTPLEMLEQSAHICALTGIEPEKITEIFWRGCDAGRKSYLDHNPEEKQRIIDEIKRNEK